MVEEVNTGGVKRFVHTRGEQPRMDAGLKREIEDAYGKYYERRAKELRNKRIFWLFGGLVMIALIGFAIWKLFG